MRNLKIGVRVILGFSLVIALSVVAGYLGIRLSQGIFRNLTDIFAVRLPSIDYILEIDRDLQQLLVAERSLIFAKTGSEVFNQLVEEYETNLKQSEERWNKYKALASDAKELELIPRYEKAREEWLVLSRQIVEARKADTREGRTLALDLTLGQAKEKFEAMRNYLDELTNINLEIAAKAEQVARKSYADNFLFISVLIVILVGVALVIALFITRSITRPLAQMVRVAQAVSEGNLAVQVEVRSGDEVGILGKALQAMVLNLKDLVSHILGNSSALTSASGELSSSVQEISQATQEIAKTIAQVAQGSTEQSGGLDKVSHQVEVISQRTQVLSQGTERNLDLLKRTRESVDQNSQALQEIEKALHLTAEAGKNTVQEAQRGNQALSALVESIQSISQSTQDVTQSIATLDTRSQEIGKIVDLITGIAEQTNLLALNAAIEAARAGEAGRGFAVVAEEVRKLAESSAQAAQQIANLIGEIRQDTQGAVNRVKQAEDRVGKGVSQAQDVAQNLENILQAIQQVVERIDHVRHFFEEATRSQGQIARSTEEVMVLSEDNAKLLQEISSGIANIVQEISSIASVAEENAASSEEVSASTEEQSASLEEITSAVESLAQMAKDLQDLVGRFKV